MIFSLILSWFYAKSAVLLASWRKTLRDLSSLRLYSFWIRECGMGSKRLLPAFRNKQQAFPKQGLACAEAFKLLKQK